MHLLVRGHQKASQGLLDFSLGDPKSKRQRTLEGSIAALQAADPDRFHPGRARQFLVLWVGGKALFL